MISLSPAMTDGREGAQQDTIHGLERWRAQMLRDLELFLSQELARWNEGRPVLVRAGRPGETRNPCCDPDKWV